MMKHMGSPEGQRIDRGKRWHGKFVTCKRRFAAALTPTVATLDAVDVVMLVQDDVHHVTYRYRAHPQRRGEAHG